MTKYEAIAYIRRIFEEARESRQKEEDCRCTREEAQELLIYELQELYRIKEKIIEEIKKGNKKERKDNHQGKRRFTLKMIKSIGK